MCLPGVCSVRNDQLLCLIPVERNNGSKYVPNACCLRNGILKCLPNAYYVRKNSLMCLPDGCCLRNDISKCQLDECSEGNNRYLQNNRLLSLYHA